MTLVIVIVPILFMVLIAATVVTVARRKMKGMMSGMPDLGALGGLLGGGDQSAKAAQAEALQATGRKARARIVSIQPTGMILNRINLQCNVGFMLEPLDGGPAWEAQKTIMISQVNMPRIGDMWPSWVDRNDATVFAVGAPQAITPELVAIYSEFGIPMPGGLGASAAPEPPVGSPPPPPPPGAPAATAPGMAGWPPPPPAASSDPDTERVEALERLGRLHKDGLLTADEFASEKARLLGS